MCASPRQQPEHEAMDAAQRVPEEKEEARLASASLAAGDPTGWFDRLYAASARGQVPVPWRRRHPHTLLANWPARRNFKGLPSARWWLAVAWAPTPNTSPPSASTPPASTSPAQPSGSPGSASPVP